MKDSEIDYVLVKEKLLSVLDRYKDVLDGETLDSVEHFIAHDEYEMAYEGLFIELMKIHFNPSDIDMNIYLKIGEILNLDKESIFDSEFWAHLAEYVKGV